MGKERIAVIGAGMAGARVAEQLRESGVDVVVFDKGRRPGGRTASRQRPERPGHDHGAQYFTARSEAFRSRLEGWLEASVVAEWDARVGSLGEGVASEAGGGPRYVGVGSMRAMVEAMTADGDVRQGVEVKSVRRTEGGIELTGEQGLGVFDRVVVTAPAPQAAGLVAEVAPGLAEQARQVAFQPTWAVLLELSSPLPSPYDAAFVNEGAIAWWAREASKPGRPPGHRVVAMVHPDCSEDWLESPADRVATRALDALTELYGVLGEVRSVDAHRWRYAQPVAGLDVGALVDETGRVLLAGDWTADRGRIESAYLAGDAAAEILRR